MLLITIGLAIVMLDIALAPENTAMIIELLPDFLGYALVLIGIRRGTNHGRAFRRAMLISLCGAVISTVLYIMKAAGFATGAAMTTLLLEIFELILMAVLLFMVVRSIRELELDLEQDLKGKPLFCLWLCYLLAVAVSYGFQTMPAIGSFAALLADLLGIVMLYLLFCDYQALRDKEE